MNQPPSAFWSVSASDILQQLGTSKEGLSSEEATQRLARAYLNAFYETGFANPIDEVIRTYRAFDLSGCTKLDEIPYDFLTFGALLFILHATQEQFRTGWFLESVISASLIVLVIRSRRPFFKSRPATYLLIATLTTVAVTVVLPYTPLGEIFGFGRLPLSFLLLIAIVVVLYLFSSELVKNVFYKKVKF